MRGPAALTEEYAIHVKRHKEYSNLVLLKYDQINSVMSHPMVQECRGLILDETWDWNVVSFPYKKFFNHGEPGAAEIDWQTSRVQEKLDGSLMTMYWYDDTWQVATSGTPDALSNVGKNNMTFRSLFWDTFHKMGYRIPEPYYRTCCFMFELMAPENRVIVVHDEPKLVLHGVRHLETHKEEDPHVVAHHLGWQSVQEHPLRTIDEILAASKDLRPLISEGYVVCDAKFNRVKVKSPNYLLLHRAKDGLSPRRLLEVARSNEGSEFLSYFPELESEYLKHRSAIEVLAAEADRVFAELKILPDRKTFALAAKKTKFATILFALLSEHFRNSREWFAKATYNAVEKALGYRELAETREVE